MGPHIVTKPYLDFTLNPQNPLSLVVYLLV